MPRAQAAPPPPGWTPRLKAGVQSVIGNVREHNEDSYYVPGFPPVVRYHPSVSASGTYDPTVEMRPVPGPRNLFVVADGMGGQLAGEQASQLAVDIIPDLITKRLNGAPHDVNAVKEIVREAMAKANEEILAQSGIGQEFANMGTTCVVALFHNDRVYVAGIGDSRVYRLRDGVLEQLTKDHSLAQALFEAGTIKPEEIATHKFSHVLYLYLGSKEAKDGPEVVRDLDLRPGDRFLLASDGLTGVVPDATLKEILARGDDPRRTADELVRLALENHSKDNITCAVVHVE